ncbi:replication-associated protein [Crucivirus-141]|nr:replication-associated protein [Crucivirus-141]
MTEDTFSKELEGKEGKEFFSNQRLLLTYKTHIPKDELSSFLLKTAKAEKCSKFMCRIAHETGDKKNPYLHTHVVVDFGKVFRSTKQDALDFPTHNMEWDGSTGESRNMISYIHPHVRIIFNAHRMKGALKYLSKEDPECADLAEEICKINLIQNQETLTDAFKLNVESPINTKIIFENRVRPLPEFDVEMFDRWQTEGFELLERKGKGPAYPIKTDRALWRSTVPIPRPPSDDRHITVIVESLGRKGKTQFGKGLMCYNPKRYFTTQGCGNMKDFSTTIENALNGIWKGEVLIINLTRSNMKNQQIYGPIEAIRDGIITSQKFVGKTTIFQPQHVVLTCNSMPDLSKLSQDRWKIYKVHEVHETLEPLTLSQAWDIRHAQISAKVAEEQQLAFSIPQLEVREIRI